VVGSKFLDVVAEKISNLEKREIEIEILLQVEVRTGCDAR
jgi:hypothetical protein